MDAGLSPPNAIAITYTPTDAAKQADEDLSVDLLGTVNRIHYVYDIVVDDYDTSGSYLESFAWTNFAVWVQ